MAFLAGQALDLISEERGQPNKIQVRALLALLSFRPDSSHISRLKTRLETSSISATQCKSRQGTASPVARNANPKPYHWPCSRSAYRNSRDDDL